MPIISVDIMKTIDLLIDFDYFDFTMKDKSDVHYFKLPYISKLSHHIKTNLWNFAKSFVKKILTLS